ncbi:MAG: arylsulfatase A-like enzyme [Planctomycetota bacterium]|jgi:arylsulfatase A-like enzyme
MMPSITHKRLRSNPSQLGRSQPHPSQEGHTASKRRGALAPWTVLTLCLTALLASCGGATVDSTSAPDKPLSVLLITLDTTRADALSCYGKDGEYSGEFHASEGATPSLDALAARGVRYLNATTVAPLTLPAHASMLTGQIPPTHGIRENGLWGLTPETTTVPELAAQAGFRTAGFVSAVVLDRDYGLNQGFEVYDQPERTARETSNHYIDRPANQTVDAAIQWFEKLDDDEPAFTWVHLFDPHQPYVAQAGYTLESDPINQLYQGEVSFMDAQIERLLGEIEDSGRLEDTLIIVAADHGESLGEHGEWSHAAFCYEATMRVPFIVTYPNGFRGGEVSDETVSVVDVAATAMEAMGLRVDAQFEDGLSLFGRSLPADRQAYFESFSGNLSFGWAPIVGQRVGSWKVSLSSKSEVFDLSGDPEEANNLAESAAERVKHARAWLGRTLADSANRARAAAHAGGPRAAEDLAALGYTAAAAGLTELPDPMRPGDLPAPQDSAQEYRDTLRASALQNEGQPEEAQRLAHRIVVQNPRNVVALQTWTGALLSLERYREAVPGLQRLVGLRPTTAGFHYNLGIALSKSGQEDAGILSLWRAVELDFAKEAYLAELQGLLRRLGRREEFASYARRWQELQAARQAGTSR